MKVSYVVLTEGNILGILHILYNKYMCISITKFCNGVFHVKVFFEIVKDDLSDICSIFSSMDL